MIDRPRVTHSVCIMNSTMSRQLQVKSAPQIALGNPRDAVGVPPIICVPAIPKRKGGEQA